MKPNDQIYEKLTGEALNLLSCKVDVNGSDSRIEFQIKG